jgi:hypothetical protein
LRSSLISFRRRRIRSSPCLRFSWNWRLAIFSCYFSFTDTSVLFFEPLSLCSNILLCINRASFARPFRLLCVPLVSCALLQVSGRNFCGLLLAEKKS